MIKAREQDTKRVISTAEERHTRLEYEKYRQTYTIL